jgi:hypothetical protein
MGSEAVCLWKKAWVPGARKREAVCCMKKGKRVVDPAGSQCLGGEGLANQAETASKKKRGLEGGLLLI